MGLAERWRFLKGFLARPNIVGSVAPSSRALAAALCEPYRRFERPARVLEVGAGTGAVTRYLGPLLGEKDELDICEIDAGFADILESGVLTGTDFVHRVAAGRVRLLRLAVQDLTVEDRYDFIISGLPLNSFELRDVQEIFDVVRRSLRPGGVFSYFEYVGLRRTSRLFAVGRRRERIRLVSRYLSNHIRNHQFHRRTVMTNLPPAHARHLRFGP